LEDFREMWSPIYTLKDFIPRIPSYLLTAVSTFHPPSGLKVGPATKGGLSQAPAHVSTGSTVIVDY